MKIILIFCSFLCLLVGTTTLFASYLPNRLWNERAQNTTCIITGQITKFEKVYFAATLEINIVSNCFYQEFIGKFKNYQDAEKILETYNLPRKYNCYYSDNEKCSEIGGLRRTVEPLWIGISFCSLSVIFFICLLISYFVENR